MVFCLNSDLTVSWAKTYSTGATGQQTAPVILATAGGSLIVSGRILNGASVNESYVATLSASDGSVTNAYQFPSITDTNGSGSYPYSINLRPEGGYLLGIEAYDGDALYGYGHYVGLSAALTIDYSIGVRPYPADPAETYWHYAYPYGNPAISTDSVILGQLTEYGSLDNLYLGAGYLITPKDEIAGAVLGDYGPDPKTCFTVAASLTAVTLTATTLSLTGGGGGSFSATTPVVTTSTKPVKSITWAHA
jgi:hypothetical protein